MCGKTKYVSFDYQFWHNNFVSLQTPSSVYFSLVTARSAEKRKPLEKRKKNTPGEPFEKKLGKFS